MDINTFEFCFISATVFYWIDRFFFFLLKAEAKLRLLHDESFTGKMTKIFVIIINDRPARLTALWCMLPYIFALTSMSLRDCPLL